MDLTVNVQDVPALTPGMVAGVIAFVWTMRHGHEHSLEPARFYFSAFMFLCILVVGIVLIEFVTQLSAGRFIAHIVVNFAETACGVFISFFIYICRTIHAEHE